ncbi:papain family cysteine protease, putative [Ichthyophthirius multifiliis]|uniref:Papain family cysteine protease, putative n=1 Tax=Ichthyophthirius multifiliis TaxID=5932 RepID=G0QMK3_ICHMU|nr:papain family cysteine protease, putative [Ichthyophthirius multifiliis]EGR33569.1 papain family cysteine protease, putative [Ichthyophthirius multifiliis]|eukprot:XP_004037555.1 papain family cysteine protease, putative [Ichthyophthirius multifiliis]
MQVYMQENRKQKLFLFVQFFYFLLQVLSTQQLVECIHNTLNYGGGEGCQVAIAELVFNYVQLYDLTSESKYLYTSYQEQQSSCSQNSNATNPEVTLDSYIKLPQNSFEHTFQMQYIINFCIFFQKL